MNNYPDTKLTGMPEWALDMIQKIDGKDIIKNPTIYPYSQEIHSGYRITQINTETVNGFIDIVTLNWGEHREHIHDEASAFLQILSVKWKVKALVMWNEIDLQEWDEIFIPNGVPHGFSISADWKLDFISIQDKPIKKHDWSLDFRFLD